MEAEHGDVADKRIKLLLGILIVITLASDADAHAMGDVLNTFSPNLLVEGGIKADIRGAHVLMRKLFDCLYGSRRALLERLFVEVFVQVYRVLPGDNVGDGGPLGTLLNLFLGHSVVRMY